MSREVATEILQIAGASVRGAHDGQQAVELTNAERFECILMDVQMPILDGLGATRVIRTNLVHTTTPVIALTANAGGEDKANCLAAGMNDFITKPVEPEDLLATIERWSSRPL